VAESLLHDQERLRGERREVAVLFADAVNFTHLSASLDAEEVFNLINDLLGRLVACVHRYDGVVDKFTGDGLMAVFGAPIAHENDIELAVRAALDMQKATAEFATIAQTKLGAPLQVRIGPRYTGTGSLHHHRGDGQPGSAPGIPGPARPRLDQ
jgi:class 3 adenylate cyclase